MKTQKKSGLLVLPVFLLIALLFIDGNGLLFADNSKLSTVVFYVN